MGCRMAHRLTRANQLLLQVEDALAHQQARLQFQFVKGLDQIVVRARLHRVEHVLAPFFAGQQDDVDVRTGGTGLPDALA